MLHVRNLRARLPTARAGADGVVRAPGATPAPTKARDPFFDNAKYLAIVLVAVGHAWSPMREDSRAAAALYLFVYLFHMPAFVLMAGYFSRGWAARPDQLKRLVTGVGVPYLVFQTAYSLFRRWGGESPAPPMSPLDPYYVTWFLLALFLWRLTSPVWGVVRHPLLVSLAIAAAAGVSPQLGDGLDIQRVLQFLPFFVLGLRLRPGHFARLRGRLPRLLAASVLLGALAAAYALAPRLSASWLHRTHSAQELGATWPVGVAAGLALSGAGVLLTACFLAWVPRRRWWFTALGAGTVYGYLLHGFLAKGSRWWGWYEADWVGSPAGRVAVTLIAAVAVTALCARPVRRVFRPLVEPSLDWAFTRRAPGPGPKGGAASADQRRRTPWRARRASGSTSVP